jgi:glycosyltransferase involved in cell wall biosynthesis
VPRVTVVIPAYNAEQTVGAAVDSVLSQTFSDLEVLTVDDGSTDATSSVISKYGSPVEPLRTKNQGVAEARNLGIRRASGEYVAFLDADDLWEPDKLERQLAVLDADRTAGISTTGNRRVDERFRPIDSIRISKDPDPCQTLLLHSMALGQVSSAVVRTGLAREIGGFDRNFSQCADWDFFIRLSQRTAFAPLSEPLVTYRIHSGGMSRNIPLFERDTFAVLDKFFAAAPEPRYVAIRRRVYANHCRIVSADYLEAGRRADSVRCFLNALRWYPPIPARRLHRRLARGNSQSMWQG